MKTLLATLLASCLVLGALACADDPPTTPVDEATPTDVALFGKPAPGPHTYQIVREGGPWTFAEAKKAGVRVSYDPNLRLKLWTLERARAIIHQTASMVDLFLPSYEDATALTGLESAEAIARFYLDIGPEVVVLKLGAEGALLATRNEDGTTVSMQRFKSFKVQTVDMTGAGDTFDGAFVTCWLSGRAPEHCVTFANAAGAIVTTGLGAVTPIPRRAEVESFLSKT